MTRILLALAMLTAMGIGLGFATPSHAMCSTYCYGGDEYGRGRVCSTHCQ